MKRKSLPSVIEATYEREHRILLVFSDGTRKSVDFKPWLQGPVFAPLKNLAYFRRFFLDAGTVGWPNGADIAPETLFAARDAAGHPKAAGVRRARPAAVRRRSGR